MTIGKDTLLEVVLVRIREKSIKFFKVKKGVTERKLADLKEQLDAAQSKPIVDIDEVRNFRSDMVDDELREAQDKRRSFELFEDKKPTATFLKMENARGYSVIPNKYFNPNLPIHPLTNSEYTTYTQQKRIRDEMKVVFQKSIKSSQT